MDSQTEDAAFLFTKAMDAVIEDGGHLIGLSPVPSINGKTCERRDGYVTEEMHSDSIIRIII